MRIDLHSGGRRGWFMKCVWYFVRKYIGTTPGPMLFLSYGSGQIPREMVTYMTRSVARLGASTTGERELFAAFVSKEAPAIASQDVDDQGALSESLFS